MARTRARLALVVDNAYRVSQHGGSTFWTYHVRQVAHDMPAARLVAEPVNDAAPRARKAEALQRMRHEDALNAWSGRVMRAARAKGLLPKATHTHETKEATHA